MQLENLLEAYLGIPIRKKVQFELSDHQKSKGQNDDMILTL